MDPDPDTTNIITLFMAGSGTEFGAKEFGFIAIMIVLLALSAFFSSTETSFTSFNKIRMKNLAQGGNKKAQLVTKIESKYDRFLTSVLIGNNIVNISLSSIATIFFIGLFKNTSVNDPESLGSTISTVVITIAVLIFGEISPKVIARQNADKVAMLIAPFINAIIVILMPLSLIFGGWSKLLGVIFKSKDQATITEDELITIVDEAEEDGTLETEEGNLIRSAIEFNDVCAGDILTPRVDICAISKDESVPNIAKVFIENAYSRLPVYDEDLDDIIGILHEKDFFIAYHNNNKTITKHLKKPVHVSEHIKIPDLLQVLKAKKCHMAVVVDEFGGTMGIVTMEDIIEELIGDVFDEHDEVSEDYKLLDDGSYVVKCSTELDNFLEKFGIQLEDEDDLPQTVNGLIMKELGSFPHVGDTFEYKHLRFEIKKIGPKRLEEVRVITLTDDELTEEK